MVQGGDAAGGQAGGSSDKAQETALVGRVQLADHLQEVPDRRALLRVPASAHVRPSAHLCARSSTTCPKVYQIDVQIAKDS